MQRLWCLRVFPLGFVLVGFSNQSCLNPLGKRTADVWYCSLPQPHSTNVEEGTLNVPLVYVPGFDLAFMEGGSLFPILIFRRPEMFLWERRCALHCFAFNPLTESSPSIPSQHHHFGHHHKHHSEPYPSSVEQRVAHYPGPQLSWARGDPALPRW